MYVLIFILVLVLLLASVAVMAGSKGPMSQRIENGNIIIMAGAPNKPKRFLPTGSPNINGNAKGTKTTPKGKNKSIKSILKGLEDEIVIVRFGDFRSKEVPAPSQPERGYTKEFHGPGYDGFYSGIHCECNYLDDALHLEKVIRERKTITHKATKKKPKWTEEVQIFVYVDKHTGAEYTF